MKKCTQCGISKPKSQFYKLTQGRGIRPDCKKCAIDRQKRYYSENKEAVNKRNRKATKKWRTKNPEMARKLIRDWYKKNPDAKRRYQVHRYNLTWAMFIEMLELQDYKCMVCGSKIKERNKQMIDHDHGCCSSVSRSCGKCVRGILCIRCNHALGLVRDNTSLLSCMIAYLRGFRETR